MADGPRTTPAPETTPETPETPEGTATPPKPESSETPPWGDDFDAERAWKTIQNLRKEEKELKAYKAEQERLAKEKADAEKTEIERLSDQLAEAKQAIAAREHEALIARVAKEKGVPDDLIDLLTGDDEEALVAKAERLASAVAKPSAPEVPGKPRPRLTPGASPAPDGEPDFDPDAIAKGLLDRDRL